ncbi:hypothetical protein [Nostoc sp. NMS8]|uniref:hypothetical protein n=1 Tax=Nostoc sp. NMS8 TaxID=2815392 RepID=UPI0025CBA7D8|nr:hypothetical protein [Nostoc sp. NMS8]
MSTQIIITLPDYIYQRAEHFARLANRDVASILVDTISTFNSACQWRDYRS